MKKVSFFNFFENDNLEMKVNEMLYPLILSENTFLSVGFIGVSCNKFYQTFDSKKYGENNQRILELIENGGFNVTKLAPSKNIDTFCYFSQFNINLISKMYEIVPNFEFCIIFFSKRNYDLQYFREKYERRNFRSILSKKRWFENNDLTELNMNTLHNSLIIVHHSQIT